MSVMVSQSSLAGLMVILKFVRGTVAGAAGGGGIWGPSRECMSTRHCHIDFPGWQCLESLEACNSSQLGSGLEATTAATVTVMALLSSLPSSSSS